MDMDIDIQTPIEEEDEPDPTPVAGPSRVQSVHDRNHLITPGVGMPPQQSPEIRVDPPPPPDEDGLQTASRESTYLGRPRESTIVGGQIGGELKSASDSTYISTSQSGSRHASRHDSRHTSRHASRHASRQAPPPVVRQVPAVNPYKTIATHLTAPRLQAREFTFTGYDIELDGPPKSPTKSDEEEKLKKAAKIYKETCRQLGVIPVSFIEKRLQESQIRIRSHGLGPEGARAISVALVNNDKVELLDLTDNWIEGEGARCIGQMMRDNHRITELILADNRVGTEGAVAIVSLLQDSTRLKKLDLSGNIFKDVDAPHIAGLLQTNLYLRELRLSHNEFGISGGMVLGPAIAANETLQHLDLSWNHIRGKGAIAIAKGIQENVMLKTLNVSWNGFAKDGCAALGQALLHNSTLTELNLSCNRLNQEAVAALMKGLQKNEGLVTLRMAMNPITPKVGLMVLKTIEKMESTALKEVDMHDIVVDVEFENALNELSAKRILSVKHGHVIDKTTVVKKDDDGMLDVDPRLLLFQIMEAEGLRVIDLFKRLDEDDSGSLSKDEFKQGLLEAQIPLTMAQLDELVETLDTDGDGEVDLGELLQGERIFKRALLKKGVNSVGRFSYAGQLPAVQRKPSVSPVKSPHLQPLATSKSPKPSVKIKDKG